MDSITNGGFPVRHITEICGLADSGKSQLCFQLAINVAKDDDSTVLYVDTKGDFSAVRVQKILDAQGYSHKVYLDSIIRNFPYINFIVIPGDKQVKGFISARHHTCQYLLTDRN